jgi:hypothetical protein
MGRSRGCARETPVVQRRAGLAPCAPEPNGFARIIPRLGHQDETNMIGFRFLTALKGNSPSTP